MRNIWFSVLCTTPLWTKVDSILIDEARTPLIISGQADDSTKLYGQINRVIPRLKRDRGLYSGRKVQALHLTDDGVNKCEEILAVDNLFDPQNITLQHHILQGLKAHNLFKRDVDYIVKDGQVSLLTSSRAV